MAFLTSVTQICWIRLEPKVLACTMGYTGRGNIKGGQSQMELVP